MRALFNYRITRISRTLPSFFFSTHYTMYRIDIELATLVIPSWWPSKSADGPGPVQSIDTVRPYRRWCCVVIYRFHLFRTCCGPLFGLVFLFFLYKRRTKRRLSSRDSRALLPRSWSARNVTSSLLLLLLLLLLSGIIFIFIWPCPAPSSSCPHPSSSSIGRYYNRSDCIAAV
jgi:hypothetical protein